MTYIGALQASPFDSYEHSQKQLTPFWALSDIEDEKKVLDWCVKTLEFCEDYYRWHFSTQLDNLWIYKGVQWASQSTNNNRFTDNGGPMSMASRRSPRIVLNYTYDFIESKVSRYTRNKDAVAFYPANQEQSDRDDAKIAQQVSDYIWYVNNFEKLKARWIRQALVCGESFLFRTWNPNKGAVHPDYLAAKEQGRTVPILDIDGNAINNTDGEPMNLQRCIRIGDVDLEVIPPYQVFEMPTTNRDNIDWCIRWDLKDIDYLKAKYPDKASDIKSDDTVQIFSNYRVDIGKLQSQVVVYTLYHRHHEFLEDGRFVKFTRDCVLENTILPYSDGKLPYEYLGDMEHPDHPRCSSIIQQLFPIQHQINAYASLIYKSLVLCAHPKIVYEGGTVQMTQLSAESTLVAVDPSASFQPHMLSSAIVHQELFQALDVLVKAFDRMSGVFSLSHGQAPSGVRAAKALRVLEDQEDKKNAYFGVKMSEAITGLAKGQVGVAGDYYDDSDGRLIHILGKDNKYKLLSFKSKSLQSPFVVRAEATPALSQSPSARIDEVAEIANVRVNADSPFTKGQFLELSGLADNKEFEDVETRAYRCAQSENEDFLSGNPVADPTPDEDLITHLKTHYQEAQSRDFKELTPPDRKQIFQKHVEITEYLAYVKAYGITDPATGIQLVMPNVVFQQKLMMLETFPAYFRQPVNPFAAPPMQAGGGVNGMSPSMGGGFNAAPVIQSEQPQQPTLEP